MENPHTQAEILAHMEATHPIGCTRRVIGGDIADYIGQVGEVTRHDPDCEGSAAPLYSLAWDGGSDGFYAEELDTIIHIAHPNGGLMCGSDDTRTGTYAESTCDDCDEAWNVADYPGDDA